MVEVIAPLGVGPEAPQIRGTKQTDVVGGAFCDEVDSPIEPLRFRSVLTEGDNRVVVGAGRFQGQLHVF